MHDGPLMLRSWSAAAAQFNDAETVRRTLSKFPHKTNLQDDYGYTPLHYAAQAGALQVPVGVFSVFG